MSTRGLDRVNEPEVFVEKVSIARWDAEIIDRNTW